MKNWTHTKKALQKNHPQSSDISTFDKKYHTFECLMKLEEVLYFCASSVVVLTFTTTLQRLN